MTGLMAAMISAALTWGAAAVGGQLAEGMDGVARPDVIRQMIEMQETLQRIEKLNAAGKYAEARALEKQAYMKMGKRLGVAAGPGKPASGATRKMAVPAKKQQVAPLRPQPQRVQQAPQRKYPGGPPAGPPARNFGGQNHPQAGVRLAVQQLHRAGMHDLADEVAQEARRRFRGGDGDLAEVSEQLERLNDEVAELREEIGLIHEEIHDLLEHIGHSRDHAHQHRDADDDDDDDDDHDHDDDHDDHDDDHDHDHADEDHED